MIHCDKSNRHRQIYKWICCWIWFIFIDLDRRTLTRDNICMITRVRDVNAYVRVSRCLSMERWSWLMSRWVSGSTELCPAAVVRRRRGLVTPPTPRCSACLADGELLWLRQVRHADCSKCYNVCAQTKKYITEIHNNVVRQLCIS